MLQGVEQHWVRVAKDPLVVEMIQLAALEVIARYHFHIPAPADYEKQAHYRYLRRPVGTVPSAGAQTMGLAGVRSGR